MSELLTRELILTRDQSDRIKRHGEQAYPNECCGLLIGRMDGDKRFVDELQELKNSFASGERYHRFSLDPLEFAEAEKRAGELGKLVLGLYHSHPDHPAVPSEYDREHAWPFYSYVIVSIAKGSAIYMSSWQLDESSEMFHKELISISE
jgi:proteasome lid subunit RPN8/RPN11